MPGTVRQWALLVVLIGIFVVALGLSIRDKIERVGQPDVGWVANVGGNISPSRLDSSELGLRWGGRALAINGTPADPLQLTRQTANLASWERGASNTLRFERFGQTHELEIPVRDWTWQDAIFTHGLIDLLATLFLATALTSFALRPFAATSWAILSLAAFSGALLTTSFLRSSYLEGAYLSALAGVMPSAVVHAALAFPVVNTRLVRRSVLRGIYALGLLDGAVQLGAWMLGWWGPFRHAESFNMVLFGAAVALFIVRGAVLSFRTRDPLVAQRARILVGAAIVGATPPLLAAGLADATSWFALDLRVGYWATAGFFLPLGFISVNQSLVNARAAARRGVILGGVAAGLTGIALLLTAIQPFAIVLLLVPLLYWWPRFERRLAARLYPQRARFPAVLQEIGAEMASRGTVDELLGVLASAPGSLCGARSGIAFLLPGAAGDEERLHASDGLPLDRDPPIAHETLIKLMETTKRAIRREQIAVEPQYANIEEDCYASFDRLAAELLLPILRDGVVIGGLAVGPAESEDPYERAELTALTSAIHQLVQALSRVETLGRLHAREDEFQELKRFFPEQIIDQIMQRGGARELRTQRKSVSVFFADLRGFTSFSEGAEPEDVMATLAEYHERMGARITEHGGTLERFAGDGFMVFFNDPVDQPDHVSRAVRMSLAMQADLVELRRRWQTRGHDIDAGMGIHTGYATVGFIGYEGRRDYAVIGNVTNLAARLSDAAGGGEVLVSAAVRAELDPGLFTEPMGTLELKGIARPQPVFRLLTSRAADERRHG